MSDDMTWIELARERAFAFGIDDLSDEDADYILWNHTAFPFVPPLTVGEQLDEFFASVVQETKP